MKAATELYERITDKNLLVRRLNITANNVIDEASALKPKEFFQLDLFSDYEEQQKLQEEKSAFLEKEKNMQKAMLSIKRRFGKNSILKGMNLEEDATAAQRNGQIGGHKA